MAHTIVVLYAAPIPVGHRVTVCWFAKSGFFGKKKRDHEPVIVDLDTGIEYVSDFTHDGSDGIKEPHQPIGIAETSTLTAERELTGRVTRCRVVHVRSFSELDVQTHLDIDA